MMIMMASVRRRTKKAILVWRACLHPHTLCCVWLLYIVSQIRVGCFISVIYVCVCVGRCVYTPSRDHPHKNVVAASRPVSYIIKISDSDTTGDTCSGCINMHVRDEWWCGRGGESGRKTLRRHKLRRMLNAQVRDACEMRGIGEGAVVDGIHREGCGNKSNTRKSAISLMREKCVFLGGWRHGNSTSQYKYIVYLIELTRNLYELNFR